MRAKASFIRFVCTATVVLLFGANALAQTFLQEARLATDFDQLVSLHRAFNIARGDIDGDGQVGFSDFLIQSVAFDERPSEVSYDNGDLNLDGVVDLADFVVVSSNFGTSEFLEDPPSRDPIGNLGLSTDEADRVWVSSESSVDIVGFEVVSVSGGITPAPDTDASPFTFFLDNRPDRIIWGNLGTALRLTGDLNTRAITTVDDLVINWVEAGSFDVYSRALGEGDAPTGTEATTDYIVIREVAPPEPPVVEPPATNNILSELNSAATLGELKSLQEANNLPRADFDANGTVEFADFLVMLENYQSQQSSFLDGDVNLDGEVGLADFAILSNSFGREGFAPDPPTATPASLSVTTNDRGRIVISSADRVELGGVELTADASTFAQSSTNDASPFTFFLANDDDSITMANIGSSVTLAAGSSVTTTVRTLPGDHSVTMSWFQEGSHDVFSLDPTQISYEIDMSDPFFLADIDGDGQIAFADFLILSNNYGTEVAPFADGDIDGDGEVQFPDFIFLAFHFGQEVRAEPFTMSVPEPSSHLLVMLCIGALSVCRIRYRNAD